MSLHTLANPWCLRAAGLTFLICLATAAAGLIHTPGAAQVAAGLGPRSAGTESAAAQSGNAPEDPAALAGRLAAATSPAGESGQAESERAVVEVRFAGSGDLRSAPPGKAAAIEVECRIDGTLWSAGSCSPSEPWRLELPLAGGVELTAASAAGYGQARLASGARPEQVEIWLDSRGSLHGQVAVGNGQPPGETLEVWAWRARDGADSSAAPKQQPVRPGARARAATDAAGNFELTGLEPGAIYVVWAVGPRLASAVPRRAVAGGEALRLEVGVLRGVAIQLAQGDGTAVQFSPHLDRTRHLRLEWLELQGRILAPGPWALSGGAPSRGELWRAAADPQGPWGEILAVCDPAAAAPRLRLWLDLPGFRPRQVELELPEVGPSGPLAVKLELEAESTGTVPLTLLARGPDLALRRLPAGELTLRWPEQGQESAFEFSHGEVDSGLLELGQIPPGSYRAQWLARDSDLHWPRGGLPATLVVGADGALVELGLESTGTLELLPELAGGAEWSGRCLLRLCPARRVEIEPSGARKEVGVVFHDLAGPPYLLRDLPADDYLVVVSNPGSGADREFRVEIAAGSSTRLPISDLDWR